MSNLNPDPRKYLLRYRRGKTYLYDREVYAGIQRWRKERRKLQAAEKLKTLHNALKAPTIEKQAAVRGMASLFDDSGL